MRQRNSETCWKITTATLLGVSFGSYRRRCRDLLMRRHRCVPLRCLDDVPLRRRWVFHLRFVWDVLETFWWNVVITSTCYTQLRRRQEVPIKRCGDLLLRRVGVFPPRCRWVFCLRRTCDVAGTYRDTSCYRVGIASKY